MYPFRDEDISTTFRNTIESITNEINNLDNNYVLNASEVELEEYFTEKAIIDPIVLHSDERYIKSQSGTQIDVSHDFNRISFRGERAVVRGTRIEIAIPFEGDPMLWRIRASVSSMARYPDIEVHDGEITFRHLVSASQTTQQTQIDLSLI